MGKRKPSKIYVENGLIFVIANNTQRKHIFDFSEEMFNKLNGYGWSENNYGYLQATINRKKILAHHLVLPKKEGLYVDHINRCTWDNRNNNLRYLNRSENRINIRLLSNNTSGYRGIDWHKAQKKWRARIKRGYKSIYIGAFETLNEAIAMRIKIEEKLYPGIRLVENNGD